MTPGFALCLKMTPCLCLEMTLGFRGPKMMSVPVKMESILFCHLKMTLGLCLKMTPLPLRRDAQGPYGKPGSAEKEADLVVGDASMWFRVKVVYLLANKSQPSTWKKVLYVAEQQQDASGYRDDGIPYFSMWQTKEWMIFEERYGMQRTSFGQGRLGHVRRKPSGNRLR